ncbi:MAG: Gfo/Idh/MocA family protein, partial [Terriglobia bacterium]
IRAVDAWRLASYPPWGGWFRDPAMSGGARLDVQVHDADFVYWLLGPPQQVQAAGLKSAAGAWDHATTILRYPEALASIEATFLMPRDWPFTCGIRVTGEAGCLEYEFRVAGNVAERAEASSPLRLYAPGQPARAITVADEDMYAAQLRYFAECVERGRGPGLCPPQESCAVMRLMDRCLDSLETGRAVGLNYNG